VWARTPSASRLIPRCRNRRCTRFSWADGVHGDAVGSAAFPRFRAYWFMLKISDLPAEGDAGLDVEPAAAGARPRPDTRRGTRSGRRLAGEGLGAQHLGRHAGVDGSTTRTATTASAGSAAPSLRSIRPVRTRPGSPSGVRSSCPHPAKASAAAVARRAARDFTGGRRSSSPGRRSAGPWKDAQVLQLADLEGEALRSDPPVSESSLAWRPIPSFSSTIILRENARKSSGVVGIELLHERVGGRGIPLEVVLPARMYAAMNARTCDGFLSAHGRLATRTV